MNYSKNKFPIAPVIYTFLILIPIYWMATISFKTNKELGSGISLFPKEPSFDTILPGKNFNEFGFGVISV